MRYKAIITALIASQLAAGFSLPPVMSAPPLPAGAEKLQSILNDAVAGKTDIVKEFIKSKNTGADTVDVATKDKLIADALHGAHKEAKKLYLSSSKTEEALNRLKLIFDLISYIESGRAPNPETDPQYFQKWIADWQKAKLTRKQYIAPLNDYGFFLQEIGKDRSAVEIFREVTTEDPKREVAYLNLADSLWKLGNKTEANPLYGKYKSLMQSENLAKKIPDRVNTSLNATISVPKSNDSGEKTKDIDFGPYMRELQLRIKRNWHPPKSTASSTAFINFSVNRAGKVSDVTVYKSSTIQDYDDAAKSAVSDVSLPPLPAGSPEKVDIRFDFEYNTDYFKDPAHQLVLHWIQRVKDADTADNHIGLAQAYEQVKDYSNAEDEYQKAIDMNPANTYYKTLLNKCQKADKIQGFRP